MMKLMNSLLGAGVVLLGLLGGAGLADDKQPPKLFTNENLVETWQSTRTVDLEDKKGMLRYILSQIPDEVTVYPTENYYYFWFYQNGVRYAGNLRLDTDRAREGELVLAYFRGSTPWAVDQKSYVKVFKKEDGVKVTPAGRLAYSVTFEDRTVLFKFIDLADVKPPEGTLRASEKYLGPVFDESGIRFFLVFDEKRKLFSYVLDETVRLNDQLTAAGQLKHTTIGWRTGFAFFEQKDLKRKILIAIFRANASANNFYDGPFDQLPDNFLKGDELRDALLLVHPELKGKIDRFGSTFDGTSRELIAPYMEYDTIEDLVLGEACAVEEPDKSVIECMEERHLPPEEEGQRGQD